MLRALELVKPKVAERLQAEIAEADDEAAAEAILGAIEDVKGRYAQELADLIADPTIEFVVPAYLRDAIAWVADERDDGA
jgi:hypothetical protein